MTVPKSRVRKKAVYTPPPRSARRKASPPWVAPAMVACLVIGLVWIALYYITNGDLAGMSVLGFWNLVIGFVLIIAGVDAPQRRRGDEDGQHSGRGRGLDQDPVGLRGVGVRRRDQRAGDQATDVVLPGDPADHEAQAQVDGDQ